MERFVDIHSHILPGIDDGAKNMEEAVHMLQKAEKEGIGTIVLTPHYKPMGKCAGRKKTEEVLEAVKKAAREKQIEIRLEAGNELYYSSETLEALKAGEVLTLADSSYVLTEFSPEEDFDYIRNGIYNLLSAGFRPVIAHAERYRHVFTRKGRAQGLVELGACLQVNAGSIMGDFGRNEKIRSRELLKKGLVHFIGTDAHDSRKRSPAMKECASFITRKFGDQYAREVLYHNPLSMISDQYL